MTHLRVPEQKVGGRRKALTYDASTEDLLKDILIELRVVSTLLHQGLNVKDNIEAIRDDMNNEY